MYKYIYIYIYIHIHFIDSSSLTPKNPKTRNWNCATIVAQELLLEKIGSFKEVRTGCGGSAKMCRQTWKSHRTSGFNGGVMGFCFRILWDLSSGKSLRVSMEGSSIQGKTHEISTGPCSIANS